MTETRRASHPGLAALALAGAVAFSGVAQAHHGWGWAEDEFSEIEGTIVSIYLGNPHAALEVDVEGEVWHIELAPPRATANAGFVDGVAGVGDAVTAIGHRSRDPGELVFKAVRVIVDGETYDVYPRRVPTN
jgi:hypothetical protein